MAENKTASSTTTGHVQPLVMRLLPMDEAPRDGTKIIVKTVHKDEGTKYYLCKWNKPYSTLSNCGAWNYVEGDCSMHITERKAYGWMPEPTSA